MIFVYRMAIISRDYQEPYFGVHINLDTTSENLTQISGVQGQFKVPGPRLEFNGETGVDETTETGSKHVECNFFKNHSRRSEFGNNFPIYYESRCNWPDQTAELVITIEVTKMNC